MILEVIIKPFFVDTLVNCLGEGAPWVPLGAEKANQSPSGVNDPFIGVVNLR